MAGFPSRISRSAISPKLVNRRPIVNPTKEVGQDSYNLAFWQIAGMNGVSPIAVAIIGSTGTVLAHAEAWDPDRLTAGPVCTKGATGLYTIAYDTAYPDQDGNDVTLGFFGADVSPQTNSSPAMIGNGIVNPAAPNEVLARIATHADVATDCGFLVWIY